MWDKVFMVSLYQVSSNIPFEVGDFGVNFLIQYLMDLNK